MAERDPQLTLNLFSVVQHDFTRYVVGPNAAAVAAVQAWGAGLGPRVVYLWGASGSGKSHLLQAAGAAGERGARDVRATAELRALGPGVLDGLSGLPPCPRRRRRRAGDGAWKNACSHSTTRWVTAMRAAVERPLRPGHCRVRAR